MADISRTVRVEPSRVVVEHCAYEEPSWSSDVVVEADAEATTVTIGCVKLRVTGTHADCQATLVYDGREGKRTLFEGRYV